MVLRRINCTSVICDQYLWTALFWYWQTLLKLSRNQQDFKEMEIRIDSSVNTTNRWLYPHFRFYGMAGWNSHYSTNSKVCSLWYFATSSLPCLLFSRHWHGIHYRLNTAVSVADLHPLLPFSNEQYEFLPLSHDSIANKVRNGLHFRNFALFTNVAYPRAYEAAWIAQLYPLSERQSDWGIRKIVHVMSYTIYVADGKTFNCSLSASVCPVFTSIS